MQKTLQLYNFSTLQQKVEQDIINDYQQRAALAQAEADKNAKLANTYSLLRLGVFGLFILAVCLGSCLDEISILVISLLGLSLCFSWLITKQNQFDALKHYFSDIKRLMRTR